jgi:GAF domain
MSGRTTVRPEVTEDTGLAQARESFLTGEPIGPGQVREAVLASWRRSPQWNVDADHIGLSYVRDPDLDTPLTRNALPVLRNLRDNLQGQPVSVMLTDARGVLLSRLTADRDFERHLDGVQLVPGFSYAEEFVGTNGIGTALESGQAAHVFGHEHYAEHLEDLACAAAPVRHPSCRPVRGKGQRRIAGGVTHVKLIEPAGKPPNGARPLLPGLVGSGPLWLRGCDQVDAAYSGGRWLALEGEPGAGKLALLRAVHRRRNPAGTLHVLDAAEAADHHWLVRALGELLEHEGSLVIRHIDRLSALRLRTLWIALEQASAAGRQERL